MFHRTAQTTFIHTAVLPYIQLATGSIMSCSDTEMHKTVLLFFWNHACKSNDTCICVKRYLLQWFQNIPVKEAYLFVLDLCRTTSHWGEDPSTHYTQLQLHNLKHVKIQRWTSSAFFYLSLNPFTCLPTGFSPLPSELWQKYCLKKLCDLAWFTWKLLPRWKTK